MQFWGFSVQQQQQQKSVQQQEEKVAKMHSSSYSYTTTIMGFRSYVRHFRGAILGLLRPAAAAAKVCAAAGGKGSQNA